MEEEIVECLICVNSYPKNEFFFTKCAHEFCVHCKVKLPQPLCPYCRMYLSELELNIPIDENHPHYLYYMDLLNPPLNSEENSAYDTTFSDVEDDEDSFWYSSQQIPLIEDQTYIVLDSW